MSSSAVVLLSGGLDSATCAAIARRDGFDVHALSVRYGQRHTAELAAAERVAEALGLAEHVTVDVDLAQFGGSALTDETIPVPKGRRAGDLGDDIPATYVPARNTVFLSLALALAEVREASTIYIGVNALDYSGYPDCRPEFIAAYQAMANLATRRGVEGSPVTISTPLLDLTKAEIVDLGSELDVDYSLTVSCYDPADDGGACGGCDACILRRKGFVEANRRDPTRYRPLEP